MEKTTVAIVKGPKKPTEKEIDTIVRKAIELAGGLTNIISPGDTVLIKPNLVYAASPESGVVTDPRVCKAIANMVGEIGAKPIIAESSAVGIDTEEAIQAASYGKLREEGFEVIDLKKEETTKVPIPKGKVLKEVILPKIVVDAKAIISVPSMKVHGQTQVTLSLKNMKGVLPDTFKRKFHTTFGIFQGVADLMTVVRPVLAVVDGIVALEGLGPPFDPPVEMDLIIAGKDPVAVDAITSVVMGFEQEDRIVNAAAKSGVGTADLNKIEVVGEPITKVQRRFKREEETFSEIISFPRGFQLLLDEKACTGCRSSVLGALLYLKERNELDKVAECCIVAGKTEKVPDVDREKLLLVGACTTRFKERGIFVEGCPPNDSDIAKAILKNEQLPQWL